MATITGTGTWTTITSLDTSKTGKKWNVPLVLNLNLESLKTMDGVILPELQQFIQLAADAYGIDFWGAADLIEILMRALRNSATPMQLGDANGSRLYIP